MPSAFRRTFRRIQSTAVDFANISRNATISLSRAKLRELRDFKFPKILFSLHTLPSAIEFKMVPFSSQSKVEEVAWKTSAYSPVSTSDSETGSASQANARSTSLKIQKLLPWFLHTVLIVAYTAVYIISFRHNANFDSLGIPYVQKVFEVNPHLNQSTARIYTGVPSDELEEAWHKLMRRKYLCCRSKRLAD